MSDKPRTLIEGLQRRLLLLAAAVMLPMVGFFIVFAIEDQRDELTRAGENLQVVSQLAALGAERHVDGARQLLNTISSGPSLKGTGLTSLCDEFLANIRASYPRYTNLALLDADGTAVCSAVKVEPGSNFKDRSYFIEVLKNRSFAMGNYQTGLVTGQPSTGFAFPVYDNESQFKGVAYAALVLNQLTTVLKDNVPSGLTVTVTDREGTVLGTSAAPGVNAIGTRYDAKILEKMRAAPPELVVEMSNADGVTGLYAIETVRDDSGPALYVVTSVARDAVTAPAWHRLRVQLVWLFGIGLLGILAARWIAEHTLVTPARQLLAKINALANDSAIRAETGEPMAGPDEITSLSSAFDRFTRLLTLRSTERDAQQAALQLAQDRLLFAQRIAKLGNWEFDLASQQLWWSACTYDIFERDASAFKPTIAGVTSMVFPDDVADFEAAQNRFFRGEGALNIEFRVVTGRGKVRWFCKLGEMAFDPDGRPTVASGTLQDITERVLGERLLAAETRALTALSLDMPLKAVLEEVLIGLESVLPGACASVLLVSKDGHVRAGAAPGLPEDFLNAFNGMAIGPSAGSCGAAAFRREVVVVQDISTSELWAQHSGPALALGLRACWSMPVLNSSGEVVATCAVYYRTPHHPRPEELEMTQSAAHVIGIAIESDRKDKAMRASELRFRNSFQGASAGIVIATQEGRVLEVNTAYCRMLGYSAEELYTRTARDLVHPMDWPRRKAHMKALVQGHVDSFVEEDRYLTKTGETVWIRVSISRIQGVTGSSDGFVVIAEDINDQRKTMQALQQTQAALNMASRIGRMGAWWVSLNASEIVVHMSDVACEIYGIPAGTVLTKEQAVKPYQGEHAEKINALFDRCATVGEPFDEELQLINTAGDTVWVRSIGEAVRGGQGAIERVNGTIQDISTRKQAQIDIEQLNAELENRVQVRTMQLEAVNRELEAFSYSVSHDLRSPLNTVNGFGQLLQKSNGDNLNDKGKHYLNRIRSGTQQMGELIEGLLSLAKMSRSALHPETVDLSAIALRVEQECREREPDRQVTVRIQPDLTVHGDPTLLLLVMQNLLGNAWKYTSKQPNAVIDIGAALNDSGETVYFVRDNGAGFDMAHADKLFGAFQRLHAPTDFAGTGVGLANVKRVVERHGGRVWAEGQPQAGATFFFTIESSDT